MTETFCVGLAKDDEQAYVFLFGTDKKSHKNFLGQLGRFATDPELNFTWRDAGYLAGRAQQLRKANQ